MCRCVCRFACCVCFCKWAFVCVWGYLEGRCMLWTCGWNSVWDVCVCVCVCLEREREKEKDKHVRHTGWWPPPWQQHLTDRVCCTEHTSSPRQSPFTYTPPTSSPARVQKANALHLTAGAQGVDTYVCVRVCFFDSGASLCLQYHAHLNGLVRWLSTLHPHAYTSLSFPPQ